MCRFAAALPFVKRFGRELDLVERVRDAAARLLRFLTRRVVEDALRLRELVRRPVEKACDINVRTARLC